MLCDIVKWKVTIQRLPQEWEETDFAGGLLNCLHILLKDYGGVYG